MQMDKEEMLSQFREDLRNMGPDGTINNGEDWEECVSVMVDLLKDFHSLGGACG